MNALGNLARPKAKKDQGISFSRSIILEFARKQLIRSLSSSGEN